LAVATSTGGIFKKLPGRVGDSPLIGCGTYAESSLGGVSCTGDGEAIIRIALAHEIDALVRHAGLPLALACEQALAGLEPFGTAGLIAVGADGEIAMPFTTSAMPRGWCVGEGPVMVDA
jgi:beta-aspartyl-peptidase (threonine type)